MTQAPSDVPLFAVVPPDQVRLLRSAKTLELVWRERTLRVGFTKLRRNCRCAGCTAERRSGFQVEGVDDIDIIEVNPIGTGALQFVFSDGHERGIFPWTYLAALAQNATTCAGQREDGIG